MPETTTTPPRLSLCMIVRDEADQLEECLGSAQDVVDEIVIADTGSADGTLEIVRRRAHRWIQIPWRDHFGEARNETLELARGEWILVLDADERLEVESPSLLREALARDEMLAYRVHHRNRLGDATTRDEHNVRLFRRRPDIRYAGRIHEQVTPAIAAVMRADARWRSGILRGASIDHLGYDPEIHDQAARSRRNIRLLTAAIAEDPRDPYLVYQLAQALGEAPESARHLQRAAEMVLALPSSEIATLAYAPELLTSAALRAGDPQEALAATSAALDLLEHPATLLARGLAQIERGELEEARETVERALETPAPEGGFYHDARAAAVTAHLALARIERERGDVAAGLRLLEEAGRRFPNERRIAVDRIELLLASRRPMEALQHGLTLLRRAPDPRVLLLCADASEMLGDRERAEQWRAVARGG